jgi:hypothetical protein
LDDHLIAAMGAIAAIAPIAAIDRMLLINMP